MSTETTKKKIRIDNGTTFGRTYTDKAVDELLKTVSHTALMVLVNKSGTISSTELDMIKHSPQSFAFQYHEKILSFTKVDSTTYQYCNNTTSSSDNNVGTVSTLLTITSSTGAYTITENVHNVVANAAHPANGGDLTNIQVGSKVYSIPSGGESFNLYDCVFNLNNEENFNSETMSLTEVGLNKLNDMFVNGKLLGVNDGDPVLDASNSYFSYYRFLVRNSTHYKFGLICFQDGHMDYIQINIERQTGAVEFIDKILTTTGA